MAQRRRTARVLLPSAAMIALAACGGADEETKQELSRNEVARELARVEVRPGLWEVRTQILSARQEGLPHEIAERMKGPRPAVRSCITPAQAERPEAAFLAGAQDGACRHSAFEMRGGRVAGAMTCRAPDGAESRATMRGRYEAERYSVEIEIETPGIGGRPMTIAARRTGRRVGECQQQGGNGR